MQGFADVACQGTDICAFAAYHSDFYLHLSKVAFKQFYFIYDQCLWFQRHFITAACHFVCSLSVYLTCREGWRYLLYCTYKRLQCFFYHFTCNVFGRIGGVYLLFKVVRRSCRSQLDSCDILFGVVLEFLYSLGGFSGTDYHHSGCQRVECSGMSHFYLLYFQLSADVVSYLVDKSKRCPS